MGNPAGVRRDFDRLERRRLDAADLLRQGVHQAEVARRVGAHRQSVSRWAERLEMGGKGALRKTGRAGRKPRLRPEDLRRIERGLERGPLALGYETSLWTAWRVADLIERECGVKYHPTQAWRILRQLGWSCQRPTGRALERDEEKIRQWKRKRGPEIKKKAQNEWRTIVFIDESGLSQRPHRCRTWAPRGQTPVLQDHFNWKTLSAMAGVTWWNFYFRLFPGAIRSHQVILFLVHLLRHVPGKLLIVWDGLAAHRSRAVWEFVRQQQGRIGWSFTCLCAGTESDRIPVVALEAARVAKFLPSDVRAVERSRSLRVAPDAPTPDTGLRLLGTSGAVSVVNSLHFTG